MPSHDDSLSSKMTDFLERELPGFEHLISERQGTMMTTVTARGAVYLGGTAEISTYAIATDERLAARTLEELVRKTRRQAIEILGLQAQIDADVRDAVHAAVNAARFDWEQRGWQKGYDAAAQSLTKSLIAQAISAVNTPTEREI